MLFNQISGQRHRRRGLLALLLLAAAATTTHISLEAQTAADVTVLKSALFSTYDMLQVTVSDVGASDSATEVTIEFRDAADQRRAFTSGVLFRNQPLRLRVRAESGREQFRAIVTFASLTNGEGSEPFVSLEDIDLTSLTVDTKPPGAPPPTVGDGALGDCGGGWRVSRIKLQ
jgi:hypothetical protein